MPAFFEARLFGGGLPEIGRFAVGNEEDPGAEIVGAVLFVDFFALAEQVERAARGLAYRGAAFGFEGGGLETVHGDKRMGRVKCLEFAVAGDIHRPHFSPKGDNRHFHAQGGKGIGFEFVGEGFEGRVQFFNRQAVHRARGVEQEDNRAARFGVIGKFGLIEEGIGHRGLQGKRKA